MCVYSKIQQGRTEVLHQVSLEMFRTQCFWDHIPICVWIRQNCWSWKFMRLAPENHPQWDSAVEVGEDQEDSRDFEDSFKDEEEDDQAVLQMDHNICTHLQVFAVLEVYHKPKTVPNWKKKEKSLMLVTDIVFPNSYVPCRMYLMLSKMLNLNFQLYFTCTCETEHVWRETNHAAWSYFRFVTVNFRCALNAARESCYVLLLYSLSPFS